MDTAAHQLSGGRATAFTQVYLPLPPRPAAWLARLLGKRTAIFKGTVLDELLPALEGAGDGGLSFSIDIEDCESGLRIQVSID